MDDFAKVLLTVLLIFALSFGIYWFFTSYRVQQDPTLDTGSNIGNIVAVSNNSQGIVGDTASNRFVYITNSGDLDNLVVDRKTLVVYYYCKGFRGVRTLTPIYNADGSLRLLTDETEILERYFSQDQVDALLSAAQGNKSISDPKNEVKDNE